MPFHLARGSKYESSTQTSPQGLTGLPVLPMWTVGTNA
jgi:hypothetical protein